MDHNHARRKGCFRISNRNFLRVDLRFGVTAASEGGCHKYLPKEYHKWHNSNILAHPSWTGLQTVQRQIVLWQWIELLYENLHPKLMIGPYGGESRYQGEGIPLTVPMEMWLNPICESNEDTAIKFINKMNKSAQRCRSWE